MKHPNPDQLPKENETMTGKQIIAVILLFMILSAFLTGLGKAKAEEACATPTDIESVAPANSPAPRRKKTKAPTLYNIPQELLDADPAFAALMEEASKYVGYP